LTETKEITIVLNPIPCGPGNQFNTVLSAQDVALYGTICALATFDNKAFVNAYLNLAPDVKSLAFSFYNGQYAAALQALNAVRPRLLCDLYLHSSVDKLVAMMRERMLLQSFAPYCSVDLSRMASQLQLEPAALEDALVELISSGKLAARIDARANTLVRRERNVREETLKKVLSASTVHGHAIHRDILRLSLLQQGFVVGGAVEEGGVTLERANLSRQHSGRGVGGEYETAAFEMTGEEQMYEASHGMEGYREGGAGHGVAYLSQSTVGEDAVMQMMQEEEYGNNM
jgi:COP9 signalosome complex subunit 1